MKVPSILVCYLRSKQAFYNEQKEWIILGYAWAFKFSWDMKAALQ